MAEQMQDPREGQQPTGAGQNMGPGQEQNMGGADAQPNPIISALQDIGKFIASQQEQGSPQAAAMMESFQKLLESMQGAGAQGEEQQAPPPPEAAGPKGPQQMAPQGVGGQRMGGGQGSMETGGRSGAVPVL